MPPTSIRLPKKIEEQVRELADSERRTFSNMLMVLVERGLNIEDIQVISDFETREAVGLALPPDRLQPNKK